MSLRPYAGAADDAGIGRVRQAALAVDGDGWLPGPDVAEGPAEACTVVQRQPRYRKPLAAVSR